MTEPERKKRHALTRLLLSHSQKYEVVMRGEDGCSKKRASSAFPLLSLKRRGDNCICVCMCGVCAYPQVGGMHIKMYRGI